MSQDQWQQQYTANGNPIPKDDLSNPYYAAMAANERQQAQASAAARSQALGYTSAETTSDQDAAAAARAQEAALARMRASSGTEFSESENQQIRQAYQNTYDTTGGSGLGSVKGLFNTKSALFGGTAEAATAAAQSNWDTANLQQGVQRDALVNAGKTLAANSSSTANTVNQANANLLGLSNTLGGQGQSALTDGSWQTDQLSGVRGPSQSGAAALGQSISGLQNYAQQGPGPSVAQAQLAQSTDATMRQAIALGASGRGAGASGAAQANAGAQATSALAQGSQQAALLRAQESAQWRQQQMQALEGAGQLGSALQGQNLATSQFALGQQQAAAQNALSYQQLNQGYQNAAAQQQAQASQNLMQRAALEQNSATSLAGYNMTYGQEQAAAMAAAQAQQNAQLSTEASRRGHRAGE
jgi:hypothetical protein